MMAWALLIAGLALWWLAHLWKRLAPASRARFGVGGKGLVALALIGAIVLMTLGYRGAEGPVWWGRSPALVGINNLLMVLAFYLYAASGLKTRITARIKNPQLTGFKIWAFGHLLVNGDLASFVLFGGLLAWAVVTVIALKRAGAAPGPYHPVPARNEAIAILGTIVAVGIVMAIHNWLGVQPWG